MLGAAHRSDRALVRLTDQLPGTVVEWLAYVAIAVFVILVAVTQAPNSQGEIVIPVGLMVLLAIWLYRKTHRRNWTPWGRQNWKIGSLLAIVGMVIVVASNLGGALGDVIAWTFSVVWYGLLGWLIIRVVLLRPDRKIAARP